VPKAARDDLLDEARERFTPACSHIRAPVGAARTLRARVAGEMNESRGDVGMACQECDPEPGSSSSWIRAPKTISGWTS
jgi:hypothetical protein